jgi:hypothetical protein
MTVGAQQSCGTAQSLHRTRLHLELCTPTLPSYTSANCVFVKQCFYHRTHAVSTLLPSCHQQSSETVASAPTAFRSPRLERQSDCTAVSLPSCVRFAVSLAHSAWSTPRLSCRAPPCQPAAAARWNPRAGPLGWGLSAGSTRTAAPTWAAQQTGREPVWPARAGSALGTRQLQHATAGGFDHEMCHRIVRLQSCTHL